MYKIFIGFALSLIVLSSCNKTEKNRFIDLNQLYNNFEFTQELKKKIENTDIERNNVLTKYRLKVDSLYKITESKEVSEKSKIMVLNQINDVKENYYATEKKFAEERNNQVIEYDKQIWSRLNQYIKEFGKKEEINFLFGADGTGGIMYADSTKDATNSLIEFINKNYQGY